ncbi:MAG: hypothetical protein ACOC6J_07855 [Spirochaetota bacterium]
MNPGRTVTALVFAAVAAAAPAPLQAQADDDPILVVELWSELDPIVADGGERPVPREVAIERLLDEAVFVLSGMVYGFRFNYVPAAPERGVEEVFELEPYATIVRGDPRLEVFQTWTEADRVYARITYDLDAQQKDWYRGWASAANARSRGVGTAPFIGGPAVKPDATRDAVRMAIRNHARTLELNRPRLIEGAVLIADAPRVIVREGSYEATVRVVLQIDSIERYELY